ncbi:MAG: hypothetical protein R3B99_04405 [Polyangiales bacterium]
MQLLVFTAPPGVDTQRFADAFRAALEENAKLVGTVYADANDPRGFALLTWSEHPEFFVDEVRPIFRRELLRDLTLRPEMTMLGRTYAGGYEQNLAFWLLDRPIDTVSNPEWGWHVVPAASHRTPSNVCPTATSAASSASTGSSGARTARRISRTTFGSRATASTRTTTSS